MIRQEKKQSIQIRNKVLQFIGSINNNRKQENPQTINTIRI